MISIYNEGWINKRYRTGEGSGLIQRKGREFGSEKGKKEERCGFREGRRN